MLVRHTKIIGLVATAFVLNAMVMIPAFSQHRYHKPRFAPAPHKPQIKPDMLTLRYKPQAGTLLYEVRTQVRQEVRSDMNDLKGTIHSEAELAFHNESIDYKKGLWSFDEYFTRFQVSGRELSGDSLSLHENLAVNRIMRLTYDMKGNELSKVVQDSMRLLNAEAQTNAYFFQPPRMLIPLPEHAVTYGDTWQQNQTDTIHVHDTVNIGTTDGAYIYQVSRVYRFTRLLDTMDHYLAIIVAKDTGTFEGYQTNSVTKIMTRSVGPISGADTTILDLFSGSVLKRTLDMHIPAEVRVASATPFTDVLQVHSIVTLSEENAKELLQVGG